MRLLTAADYRIMPWKNGAGSTTELYRADGDDGRMDWRVSIAVVSSDGPFSTFPGYRRHIMALDGKGMVLEGGPDGPIEVTPALGPRDFSGDWPITGRLLGGAIRDFNLMVRREAFDSSLECLHLDQRVVIDTANSTCFIHPLSDSCSVDGQIITAAQSLLVPPGVTIEMGALDKPCELALCRVARRH